jgi:alpha-tubulin suppressor-like RCC1 family protein
VGTACTGVCTPGTLQCSGNGVQTCDANGSWTAPAQCINQACVVGACVGTCAPGSTKCSGNGLSTCDATGTWSAPVNCAGQACVSGTCVGVCEPGTKQCSGNGVQICSASGAWLPPANCINQTCVAGACAGVCAPGQTKCSGNGVQTCDAVGQWAAPVACVNQACVAGACVGVCTPGTTRCGKNNVEVCNASGQWAVSVACAVTCSASACVTATMVSAGALHACALMSDGTVRCWGANDTGQVGDTTMLDRYNPTEVAGLKNVKAISSGGGHTCALLSGGTVKCWGLNASGELGDGSTKNATSPVDVVGLSGVTQLSAGGSHTCAVVTGGAMYCWGSNAYGQLGNGADGGTSQPVPVPVAGGYTASQVAAGDTFTCGIFGNAVKCWGHNDHGQIGSAFPSPDRLAPTNTNVNNVNGATMIAAGTNHACAIVAGGGPGNVVRCWGQGANGQLGNGNTWDTSNPVTVGGLTGGPAAVAAGGNDSFVRITGQNPDVWGTNTYGQTGNNTTGNVQSTPVAAKTQFVPTSIAGTQHVCASESNGGVECWGRNGRGQLGNGVAGASVLLPAGVVW